MLLPWCVITIQATKITMEQSGELKANPIDEIHFIFSQISSPQSIREKSAKRFSLGTIKDLFV